MSIFKKLFKKTNEQENTGLHQLQVKETLRETDKAVTLVFNKPESGFDFQPGQYLTLETEIEGQTVRRAYSLCSQPQDKLLKVTVKETDNGYFSKFVNNNVSAGDSFSVMPPAGNFTFTADKSKARHIVAFAGGSGITPIYSILFHLLENEPQSKITLIYGNRIEADIIFKDSLNNAVHQYPDRFQMIHILSDVEKNHLSEFTGYITSEIIEKLNHSYFNFSKVDAFYLCGPGEMIQTIESSLASMGIAKDKINTELFSAPIEQNLSTQEDDKNNIVTKAKLNVTYLGKTHQFEYNDKSKTILDIALDNDIKAPFSCLNGVCSTCSCKLEEGTVKMEQNFALEPEDVEEGYILACQSKPTSANISINWDDNKM